MTLPAGALPTEFAGDRNASTCIYYLLTPETFSAIHRVRSDEIFHFYAGDPVEMLQLWQNGNAPTGEAGKARIITIHSDLAAGYEPQVVVPAGVWQGCRLVPGGAWALMGCTVAPGFDYADFKLAKRADMLALSTKYAALITALTTE